MMMMMMMMMMTRMVMIRRKMGIMSVNDEGDIDDDDSNS